MTKHELYNEIINCLEDITGEDLSQDNRVESLTNELVDRVYYIINAHYRAEIDHEVQDYKDTLMAVTMDMIGEVL